MKLEIRTPAKINLGLKILGKRDDGYHELETLFQMVDFYDHLEFESIPAGIQLECDTPGIPVDSSNLVWRAAEVLKEGQKEVPGVSIRLTKKIPSGAGLGGGSGNAAGTLLALNKLWDLKLTRPQLQKIAATLGSDIPFFLESPCALGQGRGERLTALQGAEKFDVLLVSPHFPISTAEVYGRLKWGLTNSGNDISILRKFLSKSDVQGLAGCLFNDLEPGVLEKHSQIQEIKDMLTGLGASGALLSGSGSTVFGVFSDSEKAEKALMNFPKGDWDLKHCKTLNSFADFLPDEILSYTDSILL
ncbi:MAG: 4-(cytidine 5'-diphospho)-2-C-methyl-D-erythritol kinase [Nitrospinae bacterium CG11_big_fil_rev_8_21_14_0_20_45_15]|nr:MAG: 4-(cytidine 5'-diphospho)-2-C-methyl-D-erythritol kinase [Nitrospinae bacterium CG11_big_fil_rev_8_21_14_0_20_45_15]